MVRRQTLPRCEGGQPLLWSIGCGAAKSASAFRRCIGLCPYLGLSANPSISLLGGAWQELDNYLPRVLEVPALSWGLNQGTSNPL